MQYLFSNQWRVRIAYACIAACVTFALNGCGAIAQIAGIPSTPADITIGNAGCGSAPFTLPATREPWITVASTADVPMVFTLPKMQRNVTVEPGQQQRLELPRYIMGDFQYYCLTEAEHTQLGGSNPYMCVLDPVEIGPAALSQGTFTIAPHNRIKEVVKD